eukprot:6290-Heterococcus_DN1.PRE.3
MSNSTSRCLLVGTPEQAAAVQRAPAAAPSAAAVAAATLEDEVRKGNPDAIIQYHKAVPQRLKLLHHQNPELAEVHTKHKLFCDAQILPLCNLAIWSKHYVIQGLRCIYPVLNMAPVTDAITHALMIAFESYNSYRNRRCSQSAHGSADAADEWS